MTTATSIRCPHCQQLFYHQQDQIFNTQEAMEFLRIGRTKLWALCKANALQVYRLGDNNGGLRFFRSDLVAYLRANQVINKP